MIIDVTGIELTPGNNGKDCLGNGMHSDLKGNKLECCCDECDYMICCLEIDGYEQCKSCNHMKCPHTNNTV